MKRLMAILIALGAMPAIHATTTTVENKLAEPVSVTFMFPAERICKPKTVILRPGNTIKGPQGKKEIIPFVYAVKHGLCIPSKIVARATESGSTANFVIKRVKKVLPPGFTDVAFERAGKMRTARLHNLHSAMYLVIEQDKTGKLVIKLKAIKKLK